MELSSGDEDRHVIYFSILPLASNFCLLLEFNSGKSNMRWCVVLHEDYLLPECWAFAAVPKNKIIWIKFRYVSAFIFTPPGTLNGPTSSLPIILAQNMTPPPPCCRLTLDGLQQPVTSQPLKQLSGPSRVALHLKKVQTVLLKERSGSLSWHTFWLNQVDDFCAWWLSEGEYSVSQAWQLCWRSGNK